MLSINTWAFSPEMTFSQRVTAGKKAGFGALEINFEESPQKHSLLSWDTSRATIHEMRSILQDHGCVASSVCTELFWKYSLASSDASESRRAQDLALRMIEQAGMLNAPSVVIIPGILCSTQELGATNRLQSSIDIWTKAIDVMQKLAEQAQEMNVILGVENVHFNSFLLSPLEVRSFIASVGHPLVRAHLDIGNANIAGLAHDWIDVLSNQICAIHLKDSIRWQSDLRTFRPLGFGDIKWSAIRASLKRIHYKNFIIVEQSYNKNVPQDTFLQLLFDTAINLVEGEKK